MTEYVPGIADGGFSGPALRWARLARAMAAFCIVASSTGCILTKDLPDPALDIPEGYKAARLSKSAGAPPTLDWWSGFRAPELTTLMDEAQTVNLDIAAAVARIVQADALAIAVLADVVVRAEHGNLRCPVEPSAAYCWHDRYPDPGRNRRIPDA